MCHNFDENHFNSVPPQAAAKTTYGVGKTPMVLSAVLRNCEQARSVKVPFVSG